MPDRVVECIREFLDFCYIARRSSHDRTSLQQMENYLRRFQELRDVFRDEDVRDGFALPRQHALSHFVRGIKLFGSPNGLCTSITESKHIRAVKRPWRATNKNNPLGQILEINTRLNKLAAARSEFGDRGMLRGDVLTAARDAAQGCVQQSAGYDHDDDGEELEEHINSHDGQDPDPDNRHFNDIDAVDGESEPISIELAKKPGVSPSL